MSENMYWLKSELYKVIQKWSDNLCESGEWQNGLNLYYGNETTALMTEAAFAVLLACAESQQAALEDGFVKYTK